MKTITILSKVTVNLSIGLAIQQFFYGMHTNQWIDFSQWSTTTLGFELLFILSIVFSSIRRALRVAVGPIKSYKPSVTEEQFNNIYKPKDN